VGGSAISGATAATYDAPIDVGGTFNYYVIVKNTITDDIDNTVKTADSTSATAIITVPYTITFDANGGSVSPSSSTTVEGGTLASLPTPTMSGYVFDGWYTSQTGGIRGDVSRQYGSNTTIYAQWTQIISVLESERNVPPPTPKEEATVVAPINSLSGEFTAGPNPVARQSGIVKFYRQGKRVSSSELRIYDAAGTIINKVKISDNAIGTQARRQVGAWDLCDKNGRIVSEGTYLVKGVVKTSDGKREKVSVIVGVR
jgi:uncharacterized repeat protein (TIGR02543 family)